MPNIILIGAPIDSGQRRPGCLMGPAAYRVAGHRRRRSATWAMGWRTGAISPLPRSARRSACANPAVHSLAETLGWTEVLADKVDDALSAGGLPIILGGDHSLALGSVAGAAAYAARAGPAAVPAVAGRAFRFPHADDHHQRQPARHAGGLYRRARAGLTPSRPSPRRSRPSASACYGIRSVDPAEHAALLQHDIAINDMRVLDEHGIVAPLREFLDTVRAAGGMLHVSLDVDFLDPSIAPAVGTTVPGGTTFREAHLVMELLHESGLVTSLDLVELNPFLDERGRTARLMVDLVGQPDGPQGVRPPDPELTT